MRPLRFSLFFSLLLLPVSLLQAEQPVVVKKVLGHQMQEKNLLRIGQFQPFNKSKPLVREGDTFLCENSTDKEVNGIICVVELNQKEPLPIFASAESLAENVSGPTSRNYGIYLDLFYDDGTTLNGRSVPFEVGVHDWQKQELVVYPKRPIRKINAHLLFRSHSGKVKFRNFELKTISLPEQGTLFDFVPVIPVEKNQKPKMFQIRDVARGSDFFEFGTNTLDFDLQTRNVTPEITEVTLCNQTSEDRAITFIYSISVPESQRKYLRFWDDLRRSRPVGPNQEYLNAITFPIGSNGQMSRYPFAAITNGAWGLAVGIDPDTPAFYRAAYHNLTGELYLAFDLAFTTEKNSAMIRFCEFPFRGEDGFRGALAEYYRLFPESFRVRTPQQGLWMPFTRISSVENWQDFGFVFKEGMNETVWDNENDILTFRYTEPLTWWMPMPETMPRTINNALAEARRLAEEKNHPNAIALSSSVFYNKHGKPTHQFRDSPWNEGVVWSINDAPGIDAPNSFSTKWNQEIIREHYGPNRVGNLAGEYVDSSEGYATALLDFRRDHFAKMDTPLVFSHMDKQPAIFKGFVVFEYIRAMASDLHAHGLLLMAGGTPTQYFWLAPLADVLGTETSWYPSGKWTPMSDEELLYRRTICGAKPYCFLMNADFNQFSYTMVEKYMKRVLAYGMFPGFFSPNASSSKAYFRYPEFYNRDRDLFKKYIPVCKTIAEAGWEPVTHAKSSDPKVYIERFGEHYWTVFNDSGMMMTVYIQLTTNNPSQKLKDLLSGKEYVLTNNTLEMTLPPEDVAVLTSNP